MLTSVNTKSAPAVAAFTREKFAALYPGSDPGFLNRLYEHVELLFTGRGPEYGPCDLLYHDFEHTLQVTTCLVEILEGWKLFGIEPVFSARAFEIAVAAGLLHDAGYLKHRTDTAGTGAKYTYCHVLRSGAYLASVLPAMGATRAEVDTAVGAINCTGPTAQITKMRFRTDLDRLTGCVVATADYIAQMAAADYPQELGILFNEFQESDDFTGVPPEKRLFKSEPALVAGTPFFWSKFVQIKIEQDFEKVYRYLARPGLDGPNAYLEAIEKNLVAIKQLGARLAAAPK